MLLVPSMQGFVGAGVSVRIQAPSYIGVSSPVVSGTNGSYMYPNFPSTAQNGDLLLLVVTGTNINTGYSVPAGWSLLVTDSQYFSIAYMFYAGSPSPPNIYVVGYGWSGLIYGYRNVVNPSKTGTASFFDGYSSGAQYSRQTGSYNVSVACPSVTPAGPGRTIINIGMGVAFNTSQGWGGGLTPTGTFVDRGGLTQNVYDPNYAYVSSCIDLQDMTGTSGVGQPGETMTAGAGQQTVSTIVMGTALSLVPVGQTASL